MSSILAKCGPAGRRSGNENRSVGHGARRYQRKPAVRIGFIQENVKAKAFWTALGFGYYATKPASIGKAADCYEKKLVP